MKFIKQYQVFEATQIIQRGTDPYEYKSENGEWYARRKGSTDWKEITGKDYKPQFQSSIDKLDSENPGLRKKNAGESKADKVSEPLEIKKSEVEQSLPANLTVGQTDGSGKSFGESEQKKYLEYKSNPKVYWAVYDIDNNKFLGQSSNSNQLVYAASVSKVVTGACAVNRNNGTLPTDSDMNKLKSFLIKSNNDVWKDITNLAGGGDEVNSWSRKMGWMMNPGNYCKKRPSDNNSVSASGMCLFWKDVLTNKFSGSALIKKLSGACQTNKSRSRVYIPKDCELGSKTGLYERYMHDSAWIITPNGRKFAITVLTELASTTIVAVMFGGLFRELCQSKSPIKKNEEISQVVGGDKLPVILIGGLDYRSGDLKIDKQKEELKTYIKNPIYEFSYKNYKSGLSQLQKNPNQIVVLFSKGCEYSNEFAEVIKNKKLLYIVEPYGIGSETNKNVKTSVKLGVPVTNVIVGPDPGTGSTIIDGSTKNTSGLKASNGSRHFGALKFVSQIISKI